MTLDFLEGQLFVGLPEGRFLLDTGAPQSFGDGGTIELTDHPLPELGEAMPLRFIMGVPILSARIGAEACDLFFDTGAQISYWQGSGLSSFPDAGTISDFYPGFGPFTSSAHRVPITVGSTTTELRCGRLPDLLGMTLMMAGATGILGIEFLRGRTVLYLPRRQSLRIL